MRSRTTFSQKELLRHLLNRKLLSGDEVVSGDLVVKNLSRRNQVFAISRRAGRVSYLVKHGLDRTHRATVRREASALELLARLPRSSGITPYLPQFHGFDSRRHILTVELFQQSQDLRSYASEHKNVPVRLASALGLALGKLHRQHLGPGAAAIRRSLQPGKLPWVLSSVIPPFRRVCRESFGQTDIIALLQDSGRFQQHFSRLRRAWSAESLIHYDARWDNWLLIPAGRGKLNLKLVDWEFAQFGDPRWDVGRIFSDFLAVWLSGVNITCDAPPWQYLQDAEIPLRKLQPAIRAFWARYRQVARIRHSESDVWLLGALEYAAAQLVQTTFESTRTLAILESIHPCLVQLALNILNQPREAATYLLGIRLESK